MLQTGSEPSLVFVGLNFSVVCIRVFCTGAAQLGLPAGYQVVNNNPGAFPFVRFKRSMTGPLVWETNDDQNSFLV